ncbi:Obscurin like protein [Argiope bruennichi]|uniref:Obscurin like protein n=1 Tax=Argiope bruennichi TaxID=94029 RepID=A0A8T0E9X7_ARGBR|nr:Obscurin like protein [Argiope bruennichi]
MDKRRAPPLAAIYNLRRSCTMPFCRVTGKSHSMDDHHYVPCLDDFPKFERSSGCRITEKNQYFKDYKFAYPIIDLDGTARMVTEHDFHCRITSKYRAMAGHKYIYPVLGATTDKTVKDMVSVVEEESMRDVLIPTEIEMIVKGGVEDVLKMKEGEYLFIHSGEGAIIPAAMKEIFGKRGVRGRRHTLPAGLEGGAASDIEEFRRSLKIKMLSEIKNPPPEPSEPPPVTEVFDKMQEEVEVLKDIRKSRPKRPGKHGHKAEEIIKKRIKTDERLKEMTQKENILHESKEEDVPPVKLSRLEKYKMQFSAFESNNSNNESGNRLTLVGTFDINDVVELDFGEPLSMEVTDIQPGKMATAIISDIGDSSHLSSQTASLSETLDSAEGKNYFKTGNVSKLVIENCESSNGDKSDIHNGCQLMRVESDRTNYNFEDVAHSMSNSLRNEMSSFQCQLDNKDHLLEKEDKIIVNEEEETETMQLQRNDCSQATKNFTSEYLNGKLDSVFHCDLNREKEVYSLNREGEQHVILTKDRETLSNGLQHEKMEIDEFEEKEHSFVKKIDHVEKQVFGDGNTNINELLTQEIITPKKLSHIPQSGFSKNLMDELKSKLKKKAVQTEDDTSISSNLKDSSPSEILADSCAKETMNDTNFKKSSGIKQIQPVAKRNLSTADENSSFQTDNVSKMKKTDEKARGEDFDCHKNGTLQQNRIVGEQISFTSENGKTANELVEKPCAKKIKLDDDIIEAKLSQMAPQIKQSLIEDVTLSENSDNVYFYSNGVSEMHEKEISLNGEDSKNSKNVEMNGHLTSFISKVNYGANGFESFTKVEGSETRSLKFGDEDRACDSEIYSNHVDKTEMSTLFGASDSKTSSVGNVSKASVIEKINSDHIKPIETSSEVHYNLKEDHCNEQIDSVTHLTSNFSIFQSKNEAVTLNNEISNSFSSEVNNLSNNFTDLNHSIQNKRETVIKMLSDEENKNHGFSNSEIEFNSQTETIMSVDSPDPFPRTFNESAVVKPRISPIQLPVANTSASQEPAGENILADTTADRNVDAETRITSGGTEGNEKQCQGIDVYVAIMDFKPMGSDEEAVSMKEGQRVEVIDASKPRRWLVRTIPMSEEESPQEGWVPACYLEKSTAFDTLSSYVVTEAEMDPKELEALQNREAIVKELVETEEDFAKDMQFVVENYYKQMENPRLPKEFRDRKGSVFGNFKDICDFHNNVLMKGVNYHSKEPTKLGKTFLRLERDFDMHANYCWNEARAQRLLQEGSLRDFFDDHSKMIDDDKLLTDHLKLPIQRLNDYQLLLKELIKYSTRLGEDTADLQKALDFIHSINTRTKDLQYIQVIEGCKGDLLKIGRILKHEMFDVYEGNEVSASERYVFLFKGRLFVTEKRCTSDKETYHVTNLFRLQDVDMIENVEGDPLKIVFKSHKKSRPGFPLSLRARSPEQKSAWIKELHAANQVVEDLGDLEPRIEHPLVASNEQLSEETNDVIEQALEENAILKRQESIKKSKRKPSDSSPPETPTEILEKPPKLLRQDSKKAKSSDNSAPDTPTEVHDKRPKLLRQDSKKSKASDISAPETPVDSTEKPPPLSRQESKKSKASDTSAPATPIESTEKPPPLSRQEQESKKSKASDTSAPATPVESTEKPPPLSRQESKKSKASDTSAPATPVESTEKPPPLSRQDSKKSKTSDSSAETAPALTRQDSVKRKQKKQSITEKEADKIVHIAEQEEITSEKKQESLGEKTVEKTKLGRQDSLSKKETEDKKKSQQGEETCAVPTIIMSEDASGSEARMESLEFGEDSATLASESLRSNSVTPPGSDFDPMDKPRFSKTLRGVTCNLGETAVLECETEGSPVPSVTWLRDNQKIEKSERLETSSVGQKHTLTLKDACPDDGGLYTVVATSSKGQASCSAPLNLKLSLLGLPKEDSRPTTPGGTVLPHAPVFKVKLNKETQLLEGTSVRFELVVRGNPEPEVKFLKDGKQLKLDDRVRVVYESKEVFELILEHVVAKDAGTYTIIATNIEGEDKTVGNLSVVKHKDVFKGLELEEVEREPTPRPKTPKFRWFKNGEYFEANERFQVIFNEEEDSLALMFQHVTPEDAGLYTCVASTSSGSKIACSAELTVQGVIRQVEAPSIKAHLSDAEATEGGSAMLELKITGYPKPKVTWFHGGKEVSTGGRIRFLFADDETFTLVIKNVKKDDGGKYSVKAANEMGEAESTCNLTVHSAPSFLKGLKDMSVMADELLKFEVEIDGNPAPEVKWYKDGKPLVNGDRVKIVGKAGKQSLEIANCKPTDSGSYSCVITNDLGNQAEFSNVVVKASPTFTKGMENVEGLEGDTLKFNVEINGNPKPTIKWLKDGKELTIDGQRIKVTEEENNSYTLTIQKVTAADVGAYTCEIRNEHGLKASSGNLNVKMKPEFIKKLSV